MAYFNRATPAVTAPFGTPGRNVAFGFPLRQTNLAPANNERARLTFSGEFYNLFHQTNFAAPSVNQASATIGRVGPPLDPRFVQ